MSNTIPIIAVVGPSGSGKSVSIRNLPKETTAILNSECKPLPFREAKEFVRNLYLKTSKEFETAFDVALADPKISIIVIESFTAYADLLAEYSKSVNDGWEIWNFYSDKLLACLKKIKNATKPVIITAVDEVLRTMGPDGSEANQRRIKVDGKKLEGKVELNFTIVLYTRVKVEKDKDPTYHFSTNTDGTTSAKSPQGMFDKIIPNDLMLVLNKANEYWKNV